MERWQLVDLLGGDEALADELLARIDAMRTLPAAPAPGEDRSDDYDRTVVQPAKRLIDRITDAAPAPPETWTTEQYDAAIHERWHVGLHTGIVTEHLRGLPVVVSLAPPETRSVAIVSTEELAAHIVAVHNAALAAPAPPEG